MHKLITILLCVIACSVHANKIYVGAAGSNTTGNGTIGNPYLTTGHAITFASSGDTIYLLPGIVLETAQVTVPTGINFYADDTTAILRSTVTAQFVPILRLESAEGTNGSQFIKNIKFDGQNRATSWAVLVVGRSNVVMTGNVFRNFEESAVSFAGNALGVLTEPTIYATGNRFEYNIIENCATATALYGRGCFQFGGGQDGMIIGYNYIRNDFRPAGENGWPIKYFNESWMRNCRIHHNTLISAPYPYAANGTNGLWDFAIEISDNTGGNIIDSNYMTGSIDINRSQRRGAAYSWWIHHNEIGFSSMQAQRQSGIIMEYNTQTAIIEYNTIKNVADGVIFSMRNANYITNTTVRYNHIYNVGSTPGGYGDGIGTHNDGSNNYTVDSLFIYNNTVRCVSSGSQAAVYGINFSSSTGLNKMYWRNNIVTGFQEAVLWTNTPSVVSNSFFTHNYLYGNVRNTPFQNWQGTQTLPGSNTLSNNTLGTDALLVTVLDTPDVSSPVIDAGVNVGLPYAGAAPEIGWWERGQAVAGNMPPSASAGTDQSLSAGTTSTTLSGSGTDTDGTISNYMWSQISGASCTIVSATSASTNINGLTAGTYVFRLTVTDNEGATGVDEITVTVAAVAGPGYLKQVRGKRLIQL